MPLQDFSANSIREAYLSFFEEKGHKRLPSSSLLPENDPTVLFTTAGMQQFKRYYLFPEEAPSTRVTTCQKCVRTGDIDEVGDQTHLTFFEMLGNFSFGYRDDTSGQESDYSPYYKQESIAWAWEFLTIELGIDKSRIYATYFGGENGVPSDNESLEILKKTEGLSEIREQGFDDNFWSLGSEGSPGGPTVEFYVDGVEVWNLVFNEFVMKNGTYEPSELKGVDTGMGLERLVCMMQNKSDVYQTDIFENSIKSIESIFDLKYLEEISAVRRIADHLRSTAEIMSEGLAPGKNGRESVLRTLLRVIFLEIKYLKQRSEPPQVVTPGLEAIETAVKKQFQNYSDIVNRLYSNAGENIKEIVEGEYRIYRELEVSGMRFFKGIIEKDVIYGGDIFRGRDTFGLGKEAIVEILKKFGRKVISDNWEEEYLVAENKHREVSRAGAGMFKGGLADNKVETTRLHTAAHLLLASLRHELGNDVEQKGSNITEERLRFDFNYPEKLSDEQLKKIEDLVNLKIEEALPVTMQEMNIEEAKSSGATGSFHDKYGDTVKIFTIGAMEEPFSREICGGPHVENTSELGHFEISKEESSSSGVRRIKAVLQ